MAPRNAMIGEIPTITTDIPILSVFIFLFVCLAVCHMALFQYNKRHGHWFPLNAVTFGFCMSRIVACILRLVWATDPTNEDVSIAAQVFLNAGILLMYIINNIFAQRMLRAALPELGWNWWFRMAYRAAYILLLPLIVMVLTVVILQVKDPEPTVLKISPPIQRTSLTYFFILSAMPFIWVPLSIYFGRKRPIDHFGHRAWHAKAALLMVTTALATTEAGFRMGTTWEPTRPITNAAWYDGKAAFYCFNFMLDAIIVILFLLGRVDKRFHIPDKARGPGSYSNFGQGLEKVAPDSETDADEEVWSNRQ